MTIGERRRAAVEAARTAPGTDTATITVHPIDPAVVKVVPDVEVYSASPTLQQLSGVGARMPKILEGLRALSDAMVKMEQFCRKEPRALLPADVAEMWRESRETLLVPLLTFAETGDA